MRAARPVGDPICESPTEVRYAIGQPEVTFDATFVRIMSLHRSKGLTAKMVVIAGGNGLLAAQETQYPYMRSSRPFRFAVLP